MNEQIILLDHETSTKQTLIIENESYRGVILYLSVHASPYDANPAYEGELSISLLGHTSDGIGGTPVSWTKAYEGVGPRKMLVIYPGVAESPHQIDNAKFFPMVLPVRWSVVVTVTAGEGWEYSVEASLQG